MAVAESVVIDPADVSTEGRQLMFRDYKFVDKTTNANVTEVGSLGLTSDGKALSYDVPTVDDAKPAPSNFAFGAVVRLRSGYEDKGPRDAESNHFVVINPTGPDDDGDYHLGYDDSTADGDTTHIRAEYLELIA